jgi:hypothetical protein
MENQVINEKRLATMEAKIDNIIEDIKEISNDIKAHVKWESEKYEKLDNKYSAKWVESLTLAIAGGLVVGLVLYIVKLIGE